DGVKEQGFVVAEVPPRPREEQNGEEENQRAGDKGEVGVPGVEQGECEAEEFVGNFKGGVEERNGGDEGKDFEEKFDGVDEDEVGGTGGKEEAGLSPGEESRLDDFGVFRRGFAG